MSRISTMVNFGTVIIYLKKMEKIYKSCDTSLEFCWCQHFFAGNQQLLILILLTFLESLKVVLINMVAILMMSAKLTTLGLLKINVFWNKVYDIIISVHDVTKKIYLVTQIILLMWSCDQSLVTLAFLWEKLS